MRLSKPSPVSLEAHACSGFERVVGQYVFVGDVTAPAAVRADQWCGNILGGPRDRANFSTAIAALPCCVSSMHIHAAAIFSWLCCSGAQETHPLLRVPFSVAVRVPLATPISGTCGPQ
jgi:hypothetical protein